MQVEVDLARAQAAGVKPGDIRRAAATLLGGITVGNLFEQQKVFDVVVWGAPEIRQSEADIEELLSTLRTAVMSASATSRRSASCRIRR